MVVFYCGPLLVSNSTAPELGPGAFLGQLLFIAAWESVAVAAYLVLG
jgi:hypothetical protein